MTASGTAYYRITDKWTNLNVLNSPISTSLDVITKHILKSKRKKTFWFVSYSNISIYHYIINFVKQNIFYIFIKYFFLVRKYLDKWSDSQIYVTLSWCVTCVTYILGFLWMRFMISVYDAKVYYARQCVLRNDSSFRILWMGIHCHDRPKF